jgi:hypothetical protein
MRTKLTLTIAILVLAAVTAAVAVGSTGKATTGRGFQIFAVVTSYTPVDVDQDGKLSAGDETVLQAADYDRQNGTQIGTGTVTCIVIDAAAGNFDCQGSDVLPGGEIREAGRVLGSDPAHFRWAVLGGTQKYRGVSGQLDGTFVDAQLTQAKVTFALQD